MDSHAVVERAEQPYAGITEFVEPVALGDVAHRIPGVFAWLSEHGVAPTGAPFFRYDVIDMVRGFTVTVGVPVAAMGEQEAGAVVYGLLPAGRFATARHIGPPASLRAATQDLLEWAGREGLRFDVVPGPDGELWGCRLESYLSDPALVPDMDEWETELAFRLAD